MGVPGGLLTTTQVVAIERFPSETVPGIITWAQSIDDVNRAIRLVEAIMEAVSGRRQLPGPPLR